MKKILVLLSVIFIASCSATGFKNIKPDEFKQNIRSVCVLNLYTSDQLIPVMPKELSDMDFDAPTRSYFYKEVESMKPLFNSIVTDIFANGKYRLTVVPQDAKEIITPFPMRRTEKVVKVEWPLNYYYYLNPADVVKLTEKYKTDAVYFHYVQVLKKEARYEIGKGYVDLPIYTLCYSGILYDKTGKIVYNKHNLDYVPSNDRRNLLYLETAELVSGTKYRPGKKKIEDLQTAFTKTREKLEKSLGKNDKPVSSYSSGYLYEIWE